MRIIRLLNMKFFKNTLFFENVLLTSVVALFVACSSSDNKPYILDPDEANLTWRGEYDTATHHMHYTGEWSGCGWWFGDDKIQPAADFSDYDQLVVSVDSAVGDSLFLYLNARYTKTSVISSGTAPIVNGRATLRLDLDPNGKSNILEVYVMSKYPCDLTIKSAMFKKATKYGAPRELKASDGFIDASEFDGYSDDALVSFNYYAGGEMTHVSDSGTIEPMNNWGIGYIRSSADLIEAVCPGRRIILKTIGEQSFQCLLGDIRYMLELQDKNGERGLCWMVWTGGNITEVHTINATICEAKGH